MALTFDDEQTKTILTALGLAEDTTDVDLVVATIVDAANASTAEDAAPSAVAAAARRHGLETIDGQAAEQLRRDAAEGRRLVAAAASERIESAVDDAIGKGKITNARRKHWISLIQADPEMERVLAATPNETAVPLTEIGHSTESFDSDTAPAWFH